MAPSTPLSDRERAPAPGRLINRSRALAERRAALQARTSDISAWSCASDASPLQLRAFDRAIGDLHDSIAIGNHDVYGDPLPPHIQRRATRDERHRDAQSADAHTLARDGVAGPGGPLPHAGELQAAFGRHDLGGVRAHVGGQAARASEALGAHGYTSGSDIAFARSPDLHLAAHEAAHVIQQRAGVNLSAGIGQVGDRYERHADEVADAVVQGRSAEPILDRMAGGGGGGASVQRRALQLREGASQPNQSMPDGTTSDGATTYAPGTLPADEAAQQQAPVVREQNVTGMNGFASWVGGVVLAGVPTAGSALSGNLTARVAIDGVVLSVVLTLTARREQSGTVAVTTSFSLGIGAGTADNNANLQSVEGIEMAAVAANADAIGQGFNLMLRTHIINLGEGPLPSPALAALMSALGGPVGSLAGPVDTAVRWGYGLFEGEGRIENPCYRWLADRIWGPGFGAIACRAMGDGASVTSRRGAAVEGRAASGSGDERASGSVRGQVDQVRTGTCEDGELTEESHHETSTVVEISAGGFTGRVTIQWHPTTKTTILLQATVQGVDGASAMMIDALMRGIGATLAHFRGHRREPPNVTDAMVTAAVNQAFTAAPCIRTARMAGRSDVQFGVELVSKEDGTNRLRVSAAAVSGIRNAGDGAATTGSLTLTNSQFFDVDF